MNTAIERMLKFGATRLRPAMHVYWRVSRGMTLGVRALVVRPDGWVFLIKHSYVEGWHLPGGGVEPGETLSEALTRELMEEGAIAPAGPPSLHAVYFNPDVSGRDHVALYVVRDFRQVQPPKPDREIVAHGFFPPDNLPEDTTPGTRRRIAEVLGGAAASERW